MQCALDGNFTLQMKRTCNTNRNYSIYNWKKNNKDEWGLYISNENYSVQIEKYTKHVKYIMLTKMLY